MKNNILKGLLSLILITMTLPAQSQDFINIFFKNGDTRKFYLNEIIEFKASKKDADGVQHNDYEYQYIKTLSDEYFYRIEDVENISFAKRNEVLEEQNFVNAMTSVFPIINECSGINDVESHLDAIKTAEGVEHAWTDDHQLYIEIEEGEILSFHFDHNELVDESSIENIDSEAKALASKISRLIKPDGSRLKFAIANQQDKDESRNGQKLSYFLPLVSALKGCGIDVDYISSPSVEFFYDNSDNPSDHLNFYDYDAVIFSTHGSYSEYINYDFWFGDSYGPKVHSISLSDDLFKEEYESDDIVPNWHDNFKTFKKWRKKLNLKDVTDQHISYSFNKETRGGKKYWVAHPNLSELFFRDIAPGDFKNPNSIFFNCACQSLKENNSFAEELINNHGLGVYAGYTESNYFGQLSSHTLFSKMFSTLSLEKAYQELPSYMRHETFFNINISSDFDIDDKVYYQKNGVAGAELKILPENDSSVEELFILPVYTNFTSQENIIEEYNKSQTVKLSGTLTCLTAVKKDVELGFLYGSGSIPTQKIEATSITNIFNLGKGNYTFTAELSNLEPGKTYQYRAYSFDGMNYNYGETCSFKIDPAPVLNDLQLSSTELSLVKGNSGTVEITSGNDSYTVESSDPSVATATLNGNTITIEALKAGQTTITVIDTESSQTATIAVTVTQGGSFLEGQIVMTRKIKVHHKSYNHPGITFWFDNNQLLTVGYFDTNYWGGSYSNSMKGIHIRSLPTDENNAFGVNGPERQTKDWYVSPVILDEWFTEKLVINADGRVQYYLNDEYMGEEVFNDLNLSDASSFKIEMSPWGWWTGHYTYMDDFFLSTPAVTISDNFNDGVIDLSIWKEPTNLDGVREEDGIIKMEQLRTDENFCLYIENIPLKDGSDVPLPSTIKVEPEEIDFGQVPIGSSKTMCFTVSNVGTSNLTFSISETHGDIDIPDSGKEYTLTSGDSKIIKVVFTPTNAYSSTGCSIRIFSDADNGTQYINIIGEGTGKIENGDFSSGTDGFTSDYIYVSQPDSYSDMWSEGRYAVGKSPKDYHARFINHGDHTTGNGNMLIVNGSTDDNKYVWKKSFIIKKGVTYEFSAWFLSVSDNTPLDKTMIEYNINGVANMGTYDKIENDWVRYYWRYTAPESGTIEIKIRTKSTDSGGNDFAIDDIFFSNLYTFDD